MPVQVCIQKTHERGWAFSVDGQTIEIVGDVLNVRDADGRVVFTIPTARLIYARNENMSERAF